MRNMFELASLNKFDQGVIFQGGVTNLHPDKPCLGIVLSARCDLSQKKVESVAYAPVVKMSEFIEKFLFFKAVEGFVKEKKGLIKKHLIQSNPKLSSWIDAIGEMAVFGYEKDNLKPKLRESVEKLFSDIDTALELEYCKLNGNDKVVESIRKKIKTQIEDIAKGKVEGYFIIDNISDPLEESEGAYVVILREVRYLSMLFLELIAKGFTASQKEEIKKSDVYYKEGFYYYLICQMKSPYIELLMQRFSNLFIRIGVDDIDVGVILTNSGVEV
ncbi:hypothetical protein ACUY1T_06800 [Billgrantia sp. Q4P2]|uniref:hypothetical protein n=1 Tax=Billgrantia sp. Q4P2 TaxID=3463857 RepID=UPI0040571F6C